MIIVDPNTGVETVTDTISVGETTINIDCINDFEALWSKIVEILEVEGSAITIDRLTEMVLNLHGVEVTEELFEHLETLMDHWIRFKRTVATDNRTKFYGLTCKLVELDPREIEGDYY